MPAELAFQHLRQQHDTYVALFVIMSYGRFESLGVRPSVNDQKTLYGTIHELFNFIARIACYTVHPVLELGDFLKGLKSQKTEEDKRALAGAFKAMGVRELPQMRQHRLLPSFDQRVFYASGAQDRLTRIPVASLCACAAPVTRGPLNGLPFQVAHKVRVVSPAPAGLGFW
jgi:hypothetical protein